MGRYVPLLTLERLRPFFRVPALQQIGSAAYAIVQSLGRLSLSTIVRTGWGYPFLRGSYVNTARPLVDKPTCRSVSPNGFQKIGPVYG
jgi:hypothetical protein